MKYLKKYNDHNISIFDQEWKKLLPNKLEIINSNGNFELEKKDLIINGNGDLVQIIYWQKTFDKPEDVLNDGEPDYLCFDLHLTKHGNGLKILVDITYGDAMTSEFSIESPNKITMIHYTGIGSKYDPDTSFAFSDKSLQDLVDFFNKFNAGYKLTVKDFTFLDKEEDSYVFESLSNYTLDEMPNGAYKGCIKGYEVYMDSIDSGFKATKGYKNKSPILCTVYIKNGTGIAFSKSGILFSDKKTEDKWEKEFGKLENDPRMKKYLKNFNEGFKDSIKKLILSDPYLIKYKVISYKYNLESSESQIYEYILKSTSENKVKEDFEKIWNEKNDSIFFSKMKNKPIPEEEIEPLPQLEIVSIKNIRIKMRRESDSLFKSEIKIK